MDMMPHEDFDVLEQRVREMVQRHDLPPEARRVEVSFGDLQDGDPAVFIRIFATDDQDASRRNAQWWTEVVTAFARQSRALVPGRTPSVGVFVDKPAVQSP